VRGRWTHAAGLTARSPIIRRHGGHRPQEHHAYLRSLTNIGISLGALLASWAIQVGTVAAYQLLVLGAALAFTMSAAIVFLLPPVPRSCPPSARARAGSR